MKIKLLKVKLGLFFLFFALLGGGFFVFRPFSAFAWTEPTAAPPGGNVAAPINVSGTSQTKTGDLTVGSNTAGLLGLYPKNVSYAPPVCNATTSVGKIYYGSDNKIYYCNGTAWTELGSGGSSSNAFQLFNESQTGWAYLKSDKQRNYAIKGVSDTPPIGFTTAVGVYGVATVNSNSNFAVYGDASATPNAYAGYFKGNVRVSKLTDADTKLILSPGVSLCLNENDCRSSWPTGGGTSYWTLNENELYPNLNYYNILAGGTTSATAKFYVSTANKGSVVIGQPIDLAVPPGTTYTCGDGLCSSGENNTNCSSDCPPVFTAGPTSAYSAINSYIISWTCDESHYATVEYDTDISDGYNFTATPAGQPKTAYTHTLSGLTAGLTYHYRIVARDAFNNYNYSDDKTFVNQLPFCGDGVCDSICEEDLCQDETCVNCAADCAYESRILTNCPLITPACPPTGVCSQCASSTDCTSGTICCSPSYTCKTKCGSGETETPTRPVFGTSLPIAQNSANNRKNSSVLGAFSKLSQSLLIPEAQAKTDFFRNIIPVANAAAPFDALTNRKLTAYGGVITVINGTAAATHALEIGRAYDAGLALSTTNRLYIQPNTSSAGSYFYGSSGTTTQNFYLTGKLGVGQESPGAKIAVNNNLADTGSAGDAIFAAANTANAAVSARQTGSGYAGYFSGKVGISVNNNATALNVEQVNNQFPAATFNSNVYISSNNPLTPTTLTVSQLGIGLAADFSGGKVKITGTLVDPILEVTQSGTGYALRAIKGNTGYAGYFEGSLLTTVNSDSSALFATNIGNGYAGNFDGRVWMHNTTTSSILKIEQAGNGTGAYIYLGDSDAGTGDLGVTALTIDNDDNTQAVGIDIKLALDHDTGEPPSPPYPESNENLGWTNGPIYGLKIQTGNSAATSGATLQNYGIYVKPGFAADNDDTGTTYGLYIDADYDDKIQFPFTQTVYAGYFKGNVEVTDDLTQAGSKVLDRSCFLRSNEYGAMQNPCPLDCGAGNTAVSKVNVSSYDNWTCVGICCPD